MNKSKWIKTSIIALTGTLLLTTAVLAVKGDKVEEKKIEQAVQPIDSQISIEKNQKLNKLVLSLKSKNLPLDNFYKLMADYTAFIKVYQPSEDDQEFIATLVQQGFDLNKLIEIYKFWIDTDEDISLIRTIHDRYRPEFADNKYWVEDVFNELTENKTGVLTNEDIRAYYGKGLSSSDILTANRLCRMGKLTINQILDKKLSGESWVEITEEIYSKANKKGKINIDKSQKEEYKKITLGEEVLDAIFLSNRTDKDINQFLSDAIAGKKVSLNKSKYIEEQTKNILLNLKEQGLWDETSDIKEKNEQARKMIKEEIKKNGLNDSKIEELQKKGYADIDILNAVSMSQKHKVGIEQMLEKKLQGRTWKEIDEKGGK